MANFSFPITIDREEEEMVREAARLVDVRLNAYKEHYSKLPLEQILIMVAYQFANESLIQKRRNDTEPYTAKVKELTDLLEDYFKKELSSL